MSRAADNVVAALKHLPPREKRSIYLLMQPSSSSFDFAGLKEWFVPGPDHVFVGTFDCTVDHEKFMEDVQRVKSWCRARRRLLREIDRAWTRLGSRPVALRMDENGRILGLNSCDHKGEGAPVGTFTHSVSLSDFRDDFLATLEEVYRDAATANERR